MIDIPFFQHFFKTAACPYPDYGTLPAQVVAISPDALPARQIPGNLPVSHLYKVTLQLQQVFLEAEGPNYTIQSGMEARADILTEKATVSQYLRRQLRLTTQM